MLIIARNYGQLGNRLLLSAHLIAAAREYGVTLVNPSFAQYAELFPSTVNDLWCRYPRREISDEQKPSESLRNWVYRPIYLGAKTCSILGLRHFPAHVIRIGHHGSCDLASESFAKMARSRRHTLLSGWQFRSQQLLDKHANAVRDYYQLFPENASNVDRVVQRARQHGGMLVGVHIRQGDYKTWQNGRYYYTTDQYREAMNRIAEQVGHRQVAFLVCSNMQLRKEDFAGLEVHFGSGHILEDMYAFANTDWLIGPPSTYTGWASFYGSVPLTYMETHDQEFDVSNRRIVSKAA